MSNFANESKKNSYDQMEVQVTNNMKMRIQPKSFSLGLHKIDAKKKIFLNPANRIDIGKNNESRDEARQNKFSQEILVKNPDFRAMNTSPLVKVRNILK